MNLPEHLLFFIEKTKHPDTNWIFLRPFVKVKGKKKKTPPCAKCKYARPQKYQFEKRYGPAITCAKWEKPDKKNWCDYYINIKYEKRGEDGSSFDF